jgi:hypothetical protein
MIIRCNSKYGHHSEDKRVDGSVILKVLLISNLVTNGDWSHLSQLETDGTLFWTRQCTFVSIIEEKFEYLYGYFYVKEGPGAGD